ncbi:MAG: PAS domain S-box protein [Clostridiales bacterium]|jgi:PAS domain S-box-containing protein|nr:PAS domain S-box protein [Clostridiales bacterium]
MDKKITDFILKSLFLLAGIAIGVVCIITLIVYLDYPSLMFVMASLILILLAYLFFKNPYKARIKKAVNIISADLKNLQKFDVFVQGAEDNDLGILAAEIQNIKETLKNQELNRQKIFSIVDSAALNTDLHSMLTDMLPKIMDITNSNCGAFYLANLPTNRLELKHSLGFSKNLYNEFDLVIGEGFIGGIVNQREIKIIKDIPMDTVYTSRTFLGNILPRCLLAIPVINKDNLLGVLVLSSVYDYSQDITAQAILIQYYLGIAIGNGITLEANIRLTSELKFQNKLIQDFNAELEKKVADRALLFDNVINSIQEYAIYSLDRDGVITTWNKGAENLIGYTALEVIGKHYEYIFPEDEVKNGLVSRRLKIVRNNGRYSESIWRSRKGGKKYFADATIYAIKDERGELVGYTSVIRDITGIKNLESTVSAERGLRLKLIEKSGIPVVLCDEMGKIIYSSKTARDKLEMTGEELNKYAFSELFKDNKELLNQILKAHETGETMQVTNCPLIFKELFVNIQIVPLKNLTDAAVAFAFNEYEKGECEEVKWL